MGSDLAGFAKFEVVCRFNTSPQLSFTFDRHGGLCHSHIGAKWASISSIAFYHSVHTVYTRRVFTCTWGHGSIDSRYKHAFPGSAHLPRLFPHSR